MKRTGRAKGLGLVLVGLLAGTLLIQPVGAHFTENTKHLGVHAWKQVVKDRVYTRKQADKRYYTKAQANNRFPARTELDAHKGSDDHDGRYYTKTQSSELFQEQLDFNCPSGTSLTGFVDGAPNCGGTPGGALVINEVDYDQVGADTEEFVELYNWGTPLDVSGFKLLIVNGSTNQGEDLFTFPAGTTIGGGFYVTVGSDCVSGITFGVGNCDANLQNGSPDGVALLDPASCTLISALSYEGPMTAVALGSCPGPFNLVQGTATVAADSNTIDGSLIRSPDGGDTGDDQTDWIFTSTATPGASNVAT